MEEMFQTILEELKANRDEMKANRDEMKAVPVAQRCDWDVSSDINTFVCRSSRYSTVS